MAMPRNQRYGNQSGMTNMPVIRRLVGEEGNDSAAEERIVLRLCTDYPPNPQLGWTNTDFMRHRIRMVQGRKRERQVGTLPEWQGSYLATDSRESK